MSDAALGHPALRSVRLDLPFPFASVQILDPPSWAETLVSARADGEELPLVFAGQVNDHRQAVLAFDLASQGLLRADHTDLLLLVLDLIDWLVPAADNVHIVPTGSVDVVDALPPLPRHILDPHGVETTMPADQIPLIETLLAGEYRVSADGTEVRIFANLFDAEESDIGRPVSRPHEVAPVVGRGPRQAHAAAGISWALYAAAATLLVVEWLIARRRA
jgi:hypothetical protein